MKIIISGRAAALDATTKEEIVQPEELEKLAGVVYTEDSCCSYFPRDLHEIGMTGGLLRLTYIPGTNQLRVMTEYQSPRTLKAKELKALVKQTTAQWSDGIGESSFWQEVRPGIALDLSPLKRQDVHAEQVDDGLRPSRTKFSPLLKAVEVGDLDKIKKLLAKGEDINARDKFGRPALHLALWKKHIDAARLLVNQGADVNAQEISKEDLSAGTALHVLCRVAAPSPELASALVDNGADVNARDARGWTPLMWAGANGRAEIVRLLLALGADVNVRDTYKHNEGHTALMHTTNLEVIRLLLEHGADPNIRNERGLTAYETALLQAGGPATGARERWMPAAELLLDWIRRRASEQDGMSQYTIATFYARGVEGIPKDEKEALRGFEQSASRGCRLALSRLGWCHLSGQGTTIDQGRALEYLKQAAAAGVPLAMGILGECYEKGEGVAEDTAEAVKWYRRGAEIDPTALAEPAELFDFRNGGGACRAELGECYEKGKGVAKDLREALKWYEAALRLGFDQVKPAIERLEVAN